MTLTGRPARKSDRTAPGDSLEVVLPDPEPVEVRPQNIPLDVVYEDGDVIVVNKPVGMVVHPAPGHPDGTLVNALLYHCGDSLSGINGELRPGIVHRIDRDTSGLIIAAKNDKAHLALAAQLQDHTLARVYEAVAVGGFREGLGYCGRPHRPASGGPEEDGGGSEKRPSSGDPLVGAGPVPRLHPSGVPAGDGPDSPDSGPHGLHRPSPPGGYGVREQKTMARAGRTVPPRQKAAVSPPLHRTAGGAGVPPARLVPGGAAADRQVMRTERVPLLQRKGHAFSLLAGANMICLRNGRETGRMEAEREGAL